MKQYILIFIVAIFTLTSCQKKSKIRVQNMLPKALIQNVEWGKIPISSQILPGQTSEAIVVYEDEPYYDIKLPESKPVKFYISLNGDLVYLQTKFSFCLNEDDDLTILIADTTQVFNPLLEKTESLRSLLKNELK
jgi:hypothetical protein